MGVEIQKRSNQQQAVIHSIGTWGMQEELWKNQSVPLLTLGGSRLGGKGMASRRSGRLCLDPYMPVEIGPPCGDGSTKGEVTFTPLDLKESIWSGLILRLMVTMWGIFWLFKLYTRNVNYWRWMKNKCHSGYIRTVDKLIIFSIFL